jgi:DNA-binding MarR family transcriptional regulator
LVILQQVIIRKVRLMKKNKSENFEFRVLSALRRIIRSVDIYSRKLNSKLGLTTPQLLCLHVLNDEDAMTLSQLTKKINLSGSTVNGIVDRLEAKQYLQRRRSTEDRRKVFLYMTEQGRAILKNAPLQLQDKLSSKLSKLPAKEQLDITEALERGVELMELEDIPVSPYLISHGELDNKA